MAWMLAGMVGHLGAVTVSNAVVSAFFVWLGFSMTTILVNHRFQMLPWSLVGIAGDDLHGRTTSRTPRGWRRCAW
jgi:hypothetical protein